MKLSETENEQIFWTTVADEIVEDIKMAIFAYFNFAETKDHSKISSPAILVAGSHQIANSIFRIG